MRNPLITLAVLAALPGTASAQWQPAPPFGEPAPAVGAARAVFGEAGRALVTWETRGVTGPPATHLATWTPGAQVTETGMLRGAVFGRPVRVERDQVLVLHRTGRPAQGRLFATFARTDGEVTRKSRRVRPFRSADASAAASDGKGRAAVAWVEPYGGPDNARLRVRLALRQPGKGFGKARVIAKVGADEHPGPASVAVAFWRGGQVVVAFAMHRADGRRQVHALIGRPGRWRRQVLGKHLGISDMTAARNGAGHIVVAWQTQDGGEEANQPAEVRAAVFDFEKRQFARTRLLDAGNATERWPGRIAAAMSPDGRAAVTWSQVAPRFTYPVVVATSDQPGGGLGAPTTLDPNGAAGDVAFGPDGDLLVTWARITRGNYQRPDQVFAAHRAALPGSSFGAAEAVSEDTGSDPPTAAADPLTGRFAAGWSVVPPYPSQGPGHPRLAVRAP